MLEGDDDPKQFAAGSADMGSAEQMIRMNRRAMTVRKRTLLRAQHPKHHGAVSARFMVRSGIAEPLRQGLFAGPDTYKAVIRFSNGTWFDDRRADAHGMAVKLFDVPGRRLIPEQGNLATADFVLVDNPVFFSSDMAEYLAFNRHFTPVLDFLRNWRDPWGFPRRLARFAAGGAALQLLHRPLLRRARLFADQRPLSPLASCYWSTTPYRLGAECIVKYMVVPAPSALHPKRPPITSRNGLSEALGRELQQSAAYFVFGVHRQIDPEQQPIDDPTRNWHLDMERFEPLADIEIPMQKLEAGPDDRVAETLTFSPWNTLPAHEPLGAINRARARIYPALSALR